jgi:hypothetical protein
MRIITYQARARFVLVGAVALCILTLPGCGAAGWFASLLPPDKIEAKFEFPEDKTVAVLVDDPNHLVKFSPVKYELAKKLNKQLVEHKICDDVIPPSDIMKLSAVTPGFNRLSNAEIGKKLGADIVINIRIKLFRLKDAQYSQIWQGKLQTTVRVVDVEAGRLWPGDSLGGYQTKVVETPRVEGQASPQFEVKLAKTMATEMADVIAKYFYEHPGKPHDALPDKVMDETP